MIGSIYCDLEHVYSLIEYRKSHSELLLRKRKDRVNTDIVFKSVQTLFIPTMLEGIEIHLITDAEEAISIKEQFHFTTDYGYRIYRIKTRSGDFFLNAGVWGIFSNHLDVLESSLGDFMSSSSNEKIFWSE